MSITRAGASQAASTTYVVTAGKTLRIQAASMEARTTAATTFSCRGRLRVGAASTNGAVLIPLEVSSLAAVAESTGDDFLTIPDGLEIGTGTSLSFSHVGSNTSGSMSMTILGFEY